ncbi:MAG: MATE family efflux transporter [Planctomycetota bacterium]
MADAATSAPDRIAEAPVGRTVLRLGLPLAIGMSSHALVNLVDLALVGRLGAQAAASAHIASVVNFVPMIVGNGVSVATLAILSQRLGAGDRAGAGAFGRRSMAFMWWFGALVSIATALPAAPCVDSIGTDGAVRADAIHYLVVSNLGCLPMFVLMQATALMRAVGETMVPLALLLFANALNLLLDVVLLFGWREVGIEPVGVAGAAYASVAARTVSAALAVWWLRRPRHPLGIRDAARDRAEPVARPLFEGAWPQAVQIGLRAALVWGLTAIVQRKVGTDGTAALAVTTRLDTLVLFAAIGFASAATTVAGRAVVRGDSRRARSAGVHAGVQALLFGGAIVLGFREFAEPVIRSFLPDAEPPVVAAGVMYLTIAAAAQPFAACALGAMGALHGAGRMLAPLLVDLVGFAGLAAALLLAARLELRAVYLVLVGGAVALALLHLVFVVVGRWPVGRSGPARGGPADGGSGAPSPSPGE